MSAGNAHSNVFATHSYTTKHAEWLAAAGWLLELERYAVKAISGACRPATLPLRPKKRIANSVHLRCPLSSALTAALALFVFSFHSRHEQRQLATHARHYSSPSSCSLLPAILSSSGVAISSPISINRRDR